MVLAVSIIVILIVSFLLALRSLFSELAKPHHLKKIHSKLQKEKVLFKRS